MKTIRLNGDFDLFDDGTVRLMRAPGHTPGSQFMVVKLPKTGSLILTSDCVYSTENLDKNLIPPIPGTSRSSVRAPSAATSAVAWRSRAST